MQLFLRTRTDSWEERAGLSGEWQHDAGAMCTGWHMVSGIMQRHRAGLRPCTVHSTTGLSYWQISNQLWNLYLPGKLCWACFFPRQHPAHLSMQLHKHLYTSGFGMRLVQNITQNTLCQYPSPDRWSWFKETTQYNTTHTDTSPRILHSVLKKANVPVECSYSGRYYMFSVCFSVSFQCFGTNKTVNLFYVCIIKPHRSTLIWSLFSSETSYCEFFLFFFFFSQVWCEKRGCVCV